MGNACCLLLLLPWVLSSPASLMSRFQGPCCLLAMCKGSLPSVSLLQAHICLMPEGTTLSLAPSTNLALASVCALREQAQLSLELGCVRWLRAAGMIPALGLHWGEIRKKGGGG